MHGRSRRRKIPGCVDALITVSANNSIDAIPECDWNALVGSEYPFLQHAFLSAAERCGCASPETGWTPRHLTLHQDGQLRAAMPLYEKSHSWGEFVFDWAWAQAYQRAGLEYYPKLVSAIPFTPAQSSRILLADAADKAAATILMRAAIQLAQDSDCSSLHILFPDPADLDVCRELNMKIRKDCQFHWHNQNYRTFNDFLQNFSARKRKNVLRDRRRVSEAGITFRKVHGNDMSAADWVLAYELISNTFMRRGSMPYFDLAFFRAISAALTEQVLVIFAEKMGEAIAAAVFFVGPTTLYGRYWGSNGHHDALHFETCYYQGIEYCIASGKTLFEPGTQGEHKIARGFSPVATWSAHWLRHPEFLTAIGAYVSEESRHVDRYMEDVTAHSPYRSSSEKKS